MGNEMWKIKLQKIVGKSLDKLRTLNMNGTILQKYLAVLKEKKNQGNICFFEQVFYGKQLLSGPK